MVGETLRPLILEPSEGIYQFLQRGRLRLAAGWLRVPQLHGTVTLGNRSHACWTALCLPFLVFPRPIRFSGSSEG